VKRRLALAGSGRSRPQPEPAGSPLTLARRINAATYVAGLVSRGDPVVYESALEWAFHRLDPEAFPR
jgi:hypothetical protein